MFGAHDDLLRTLGVIEKMVIMSFCFLPLADANNGRGEGEKFMVALNGQVELLGNDTFVRQAQKCKVEWRFLVP